jgi:hypothetical protein
VVEHPFLFLPPLASVPLPWEKNMPVAEESHQEIICHGSLKNRELSQKKEEVADPILTLAFNH